MVKLLKNRYGKISNNIGKKHTFVGINFEFTNTDSLTLDMVDHLKDTLDTFTEELGSIPTSSVSEFLFDVNPHVNLYRKKIERYSTVYSLGSSLLKIEQDSISRLR